MLAHLQRLTQPLGSRAWSRPAFVAHERLVEPQSMLVRRPLNWTQQSRWWSAKQSHTLNWTQKYFESSNTLNWSQHHFESSNTLNWTQKYFESSSTLNWTEQKRWLSATGVHFEGYRRKFDPERIHARRDAQQRQTEATSRPSEVEEPAAIEAPAGDNKDGLMKKLVGLGVVGAALGKFSGGVKLLFVVLKLAKMPALLSLLASTAAYSFVFGWPWGVGMVALLLVHESGHALAMHHYRIPFSPMVFIPFMGAVVSMKEQPPDAYTNAMIALAGPVLGTLGAIGFAASGLLLDSQLLLALGSFGVTINLFNMLPIGMLDGGQIAGALSKYFLLAGWLLGLGLLVTLPNVSPIFYLVMIMSTWTTYQRFRHPPTDPSFYRITPVQRANIALGYLAVLGVLLLASATISRRLLSPKQLRAKEGGKPSDLEKSLLGYSELDKDDDEWKWAAEQDRRDRHPENRDRGRWV